MRENTEQKISEYEHFFLQCKQNQTYIKTKIRDRDKL